MTDPDIQTLTRFNLAETDDGYLLEIGDHTGGLLRVTACAEQLDAILEALDAHLSDEDDVMDAA